MNRKCVKKFQFKVQEDWAGLCVDGRLQSPISIPSIRDRTLVDKMKIEFTNMRVPIKDITVTNSARQSKFKSKTRS